MVTNELKDPRVGFVTITEVRPAPDLKSARVYVSIYGTDAERKESLAGLNAAAGYLQRQLGRRVKLRYIPHLTFAVDESLDRAMRIEALLDAAANGRTETPGVEPVDALPIETPRRDLKDKADNLATADKPKLRRPARRARRRRR